MHRKLALGLLSFLVLNVSLAQASNLGGWNGELNRNLPGCKDFNGRDMTVNNRQVLEWKQTTKNQFKDRGYVAGVLVGQMANNHGHLHLDVFLGETPSGTGKESDIELIYNTEFGEVPNNLKAGMEVAACGDYITSNQSTGRYPASPLDAIIHWIHKSMDDRHPNGFLMIDGTLYGQEDAPPRGGYRQGGGSDQGNDNIQGWFQAPSFQ